MYSTPEDDAILQDWQHCSGDEIGGAIIQVTKDLRDELSPTIRELLHHGDPYVRAEAITGLLARLCESDLVLVAVQMLHSDPDAVFVREGAAAALGRYVATCAPDQSSQVLKELVGQLIVEPNPPTRAAIYDAIRRIIDRGDPLGSRPSWFDFDIHRDVDWDELGRWVPDHLTVPDGIKSTRDHSSPQDLKTALDHARVPGERLAAIERLMLDHRQEARLPIEELIMDTNQNTKLRTQALNQYVGAWQYSSLGKMSRLLKTEEDHDLRLAAVRALVATHDAWYGEGFNLATRHLLTALRNNPSEAVKEVAYRSILTTLGRPDAVPDRFDPDAIDCDLINSLVPES